MQVKNRFDFSQVADKRNQVECEDFVREFKLDDPMKKEHFLLPDLNNLQVLQRMIEEDADLAVIKDETLAAVAQRLIWLVEEVGSLRRTNRNLRSKNLRLKKRAEKPETLFIPDAVQKQILLSTKHMDLPVHYPKATPLISAEPPVERPALDTGGRVPGGGYQPLARYCDVVDANGKAVPQNPPRGR